jgi:2-polyprenyl-6-methoxyphenol hydroxylase-like FAD-dependent oxidoreductase
MNLPPNRLSVLVVGAGPVGLLTALIALRKGCRVCLVERLSETTTSFGRCFSDRRTLISLDDSVVRFLAEHGFETRESLRELGAFDHGCMPPAGDSKYVVPVGAFQKLYLLDHLRKHYHNNLECLFDTHVAGFRFPAAAAAAGTAADQRAATNTIGSPPCLISTCTSQIGIVYGTRTAAAASRM